MAFAMLKDVGARMGVLLDAEPGPPRGKAGAIEVYKVEPYVMSADVYGLPPILAAEAGPGTPCGGWDV